MGEISSPSFSSRRTVAISASNSSSVVQDSGCGGRVGGGSGEGSDRDVLRFLPSLFALRRTRSASFLAFLSRKYSRSSESSAESSVTLKTMMASDDEDGPGEGGRGVTLVGCDENDLWSVGEDGADNGGGGWSSSLLSSVGMEMTC